MAVQTAYTPDTYQGDGLSTAFPITFVYQSYTDLVLSTTVVATGVVTPLVYGTDYTVLPLTNSPAATGTVTLLTPLANGTDLTIARSTPVTQLTVWTPNDANPSVAIQNATDKLTLIAQELEAEIAAIPSNSGGATAIVTTAAFAMAAVSASQTITVTSSAGFAVGNVIRISNSALTMYATITSIPSATTITCTTNAITSGSTGTNVPTGAAVQLGQVPNATSVTAADINTSATPVTGFLFNNDIDQVVGLSISISGGVATVNSVLNSNIPLSDLTGSGLSVLSITPPSLLVGQTMASTASGVLKANAGLTALSFGLLDATNISANSLTPALLRSTNSPSDTQVPAYDLATGKFTWTNPGGGGVPGGGTAAQFLGGASGGTWTNRLTKATSSFNLIELATTSTSQVANFDNGNGVGLRLLMDSSAGTTDYRQQFQVLGAVIANGPAQATIDNTVSYGSKPTEGAAFGGIIRATGMRTTHGPWQFAYTVNAPAASLTVDLANGAYQRLTGFANNVTITLADNTLPPTFSGYQYASQLTLEINAPGIYTVTFPGSVTWANGGSAPTLNTSGVNIIRLIRRQGQVQWIGYVDGGTFSLTAGIINNSAYFANSVIPLAALSATGTPTSAKFLRGDNTWATPSGSVLATNNGVTISGGPFTTLQFGANLSGTDLGSGVLGIAAAGGGGGFSAANPYTWTATQTYLNVPQNFNSSFPSLGGTTSSVSINNSYPNILYADADAINITVNNSYATPPGGGGVQAMNVLHTVTAATGGSHAAIFTHDLRSTLASGFNIGFEAITTSKRITGTAAADGVWLNSWGPCHLFSATPDATGVIHTWTTGFVRAGEVNYGNAWQDWGLLESILGANYSGGLTFAPDWLAGNTGATTESHYDAQWAIAIGYAGPDNRNPNPALCHAPQNHIGLFFTENAISPGGYAIRIRGATSTGYPGGFNGNTPTVNAAGALIKMSDTCQTGIDFAGTTGDSTVCTATNTGNPMITMADDQSIKFGSIWLRGHLGALQASTDGAIWTNITIP